MILLLACAAKTVPTASVVEPAAPVAVEEPVERVSDEPAWEESPVVVITHSCPPIVEYIHFDTSSTEPLDESMAVITIAAEVLIENPEITLLAVIGHADKDEGSDAQTMALARSRAEVVVAGLVAGGVEPARLVVESRGEHAPLEWDDPKWNRRVEFSILEQEE